MIGTIFKIIAQTLLAIFFLIIGYVYELVNVTKRLEAEHKKECETCIHKVSNEEIEFLLELKANEVKQSTIKPIKDLLDSNVARIYFYDKVKEIIENDYTENSK